MTMAEQTASGETRVGLLGAGYIADWHAEALQRTPGVRVTAVCDAAKNKAEALAQSVGAEHAYGDLAEMLEAGVCDAVHVLLPPHLHFPLAKQVLEAGVHAFLEKPMCLTQADCDGLVTLAQERGVKVGCNHNFLCLPAYEKLHGDVADGTLGKLDHVTIDWMFPLGQIAGGPHGGWLFAHPGNALFELAPHCFAFVEHLLGGMDVVHTHASNPIDLPGGRVAYRRWQMQGLSAEGVGVDVRLSIGDGFPRRAMHVRGTGGAATYDFERDTYVRQASNTKGIIFEPWAAAKREAKLLQREGLRNLWTQGKSLNKLAPFGLSLRNSVRSFYATLGDDALDRRVAGATGAAVIGLTQRVVDAAVYTPAYEPPAEPAATRAPEASDVSPTVLVLGGTGFIGQRLVHQLVDAGHAVRVVSRGDAPGLDRRGGMVQVVRASIGDPDDMARALDGIEVVYHLARAYAETWDEYLKNDVEVTRRVGEACVKAGVKRLIYTGTIDSYDAGKGHDKITESTGLDPKIGRRNLYAQSKGMCEAELMKLHKEQGLPLVIARPGIVIGSGGSPLHWGVGMWPSPTVCTLWGNGQSALPLVLVDDCAAALVKMLDADGVEGEDFNLIGDATLNGRAYLAACEAAGGVKLQVSGKPIWRYYAGDMLKYAVKKAAKRPNVVKPSYHDWRSRTQQRGFDNTKAKERLGWEPTADEATLIEQGIATPMRELMR